MNYYRYIKKKKDIIKMNYYILLILFILYNNNNDNNNNYSVSRPVRSDNTGGKVESLQFVSFL